MKMKTSERKDRKRELKNKKQQIRFSDLVSKALTQIKEQRVVIYFNLQIKGTMCNVIIVKICNLN
jgi:hypothetical protein